jgi:GNAT superfamily N-acetyltransferase
MGVPQIEIITWYLEMHKPPERVAPRAEPAGLRIEHCLSPTLSFYYYLVITIGERWAWAGPRTKTPEENRAIIADPAVYLFVPYMNGVPAGMAEVHTHKHPEVELMYFGLVPEFIGKGLGSVMLSWTIDRVFRMGAERFWLHTCSLDSPQALEVYKKAGFTVYDEKRHEVPDPAQQGLFGEDRPRYLV